METEIMGEYKVEKGVAQSRNTVPVKDWKIYHFIEEYKDRFKKTVGYPVRQATGTILAHLNQKTIIKLYRMEGRGVSIPPSELFMEYMEWLFAAKGENIRPFMFANDENMEDFLNDRVAKSLRKDLGYLSEFERAEAERRKKAEEYFEANKRRMLEEKAAEEKAKKEKEHDQKSDKAVDFKADL